LNTHEALRPGCSDVALLTFISLLAFVALLAFISLLAFVALLALRAGKSFRESFDFVGVVGVAEARFAGDQTQHHALRVFERADQNVAVVVVVDGRRGCRPGCVGRASCRGADPVRVDAVFVEGRKPDGAVLRRFGSCCG